MGSQLIQCLVDYYGSDANAFISYIEDMHSTFNLPIRVTEWACQVVDSVYSLYVKTQLMETTFQGFCRRTAMFRCSG